MQTEFLYTHSAIATLAALAVYFVLTINVARARVSFNVPPPQTTGPDGFVRRFRVHLNTVEQLILFLPLLWLAAVLFNDTYAAATGLCWSLSRIIYAIGYYSDSSKRLPGFILGTVCNVVLFFMASYGLLMQFSAP